MKLKEILKSLTEEEILAKLDNDDHYYGDFGKQFLSNSNIYDLINNPEQFGKSFEKTVPLVVGGAFHTIVLEPHKFEDNYPVVETSSRRTNKYKEAAGDDILLITEDLENLNAMKDRIEGNELLNGLIRGEGVDYEVPAYGEIFGEYWKGKADVVNHRDKLIVDLKTTSDLKNFHRSAKKYNYDSQAYIYREFFGYDFVFAVIDKKSHQLGFFDCSPAFYEDGKQKVMQAVHTYRMLFKDGQEFDFANYLISETL